MNNYFGFYGLIDEFIAGKKLEPFKNNFISKELALNSFDRLFSKLGKYKYWILSYNSSSYPEKDQILQLLEKYATEVIIKEKNHAYQVTGKVNKNTNREYIFIAKR
jgi:adenine-specific DNA-methyltransferase